jgi:hypothetical protein
MEKIQMHPGQRSPVKWANMEMDREVKKEYAKVKGKNNEG